MATVKSAKRWFWWHKWTSLLCTVFLLLLCVTGLPLVFHEEIEHWTEHHGHGEAASPQDRASLDKILTEAKVAEPNKVTRFIFWDDAHPDAVFLSLSDSLMAPADNYTIVEMDAHSGQVAQHHDDQEGFMYVMLRLHTDLFAGLGGKLFLGLMGILFVISIVTGVVLYGPIMKKFDFGMIRTGKSRRLKWLDMHNLLGIVALFWTLVVGLTGTILATSDIVVGLWQQGQLAEMTAPYQHAAPLHPDSLASLDQAARVAMAAAPDMQLRTVAMPGTMFSSKHHYAIFMNGNTPLTAKLLKPALIDAKTGELTDMRDMPWYVNTLFLSQPLHFGDYGGLPLKIIWALLDAITIAILITGLYLWIARLKATRAQLAWLDGNWTDMPASTI
ncbi:PepSY-associated TM helix domain-containing protein [Sphingobacterium suaedae]|uniref:PepSY-associated TM helix domain-containing protein n=1 Tax=Sphingobacterium suaedae TaxID=1686402 RepID=A0ABW5KHJ7_9SPHI